MVHFNISERDIPHVIPPDGTNRQAYPAGLAVLDEDVLGVFTISCDAEGDGAVTVQ